MQAVEHHCFPSRGPTVPHWPQDVVLNSSTLIFVFVLVTFLVFVFEFVFVLDFAFVFESFICIHRQCHLRVNQTPNSIFIIAIIIIIITIIIIIINAIFGWLRLQTPLLVWSCPFSRGSLDPNLLTLLIIIITITITIIIIIIIIIVVVFIIIIKCQIPINLGSLSYHKPVYDTRR